MSVVKNFPDLVKYYHENKLSHAYLIETNNIESCFEDLKQIVKEINCQDRYNPKCNNCNLCNLLDNNFLPSFIVIEPDGINIKKEQVLDLKSRFSTMPTFTKENIYIIKNAEKLNASSANTMLKFLEEPEEHIIGFFITNSANNVISTIKSRCEIITISYEENDINYKENIYYDVAKSFLESISREPKQSFSYNKNIILDKYKEKNDIIGLLKLILYIYEQVISSKISKSFNDFSTEFNYLLNKDLQKLIKEEKLLTTFIDDLNYNVNIELFLDRLIIELGGYNG